MKNNLNEKLEELIKFFFDKKLTAGANVLVLKNGKEVARLSSNTKAISYLTDSLVGVLANDYNDKAIKKERFQK